MPATGRRTLLAAAAAGLLLRGSARAAAAGPVVETPSGKLRGVRANGVISFKGVRYGETTGGTNRFRPPVPVSPWAGVQDADSFGNSAPQQTEHHSELMAWYSTIQPVSEDCLFLNVFTPAVEQGNRPVMVWLHGGGWASCAGTAPGFDGSWLARDMGVVVVTINHRLNVFGSLNLDDSDPRFADAGVVGVLDMVQALRWVRDSIAAFGGNPHNVTIFGQSGGAAKVTALMGMPAARGLFHKAIVQSCSGGLRLDGQEESAKQAQTLAAALGTQLNGAALQAVPVDKLLAAAKTVSDPFRPVQDGRNFPHNPFDPGAPAEAKGVPLMIGNAATEVTLFMAADPANFKLNAAAVTQRVGQYLGTDEAHTKRIIDAYRTAQPNATPSDLLAAIATDYMYRRNTMRVAALQSSHAPVYAYVFNWQTPVLGGVLKSPHTLEVPFAFGTTEAAAPLVGTGSHIPRLTAQTMMRWASFARNGVPVGPDHVAWAKYDTAHRATMMLDLECHMANNPGGDARATLDALPYFEYSRPASFTHA